MSLLGQKNTKVRPLNDRKAIEDGATFLAETFVFGVAGSIIVYETYKAKKKQNERTEMIEDDIRALQDEIEYIRKKLNEHNVKLDDYTLPKELKPKILKIRDGTAESQTPNIITPAGLLVEGHSGAGAGTLSPLGEKLSESAVADQRVKENIEALEKKYESIKAAENVPLDTPSSEWWLFFFFSFSISLSDHDIWMTISLDLSLKIVYPREWKIASSLYIK